MQLQLFSSSGRASSGGPDTNRADTGRADIGWTDTVGADPGRSGTGGSGASRSGRHSTSDEQCCTTTSRRSSVRSQHSCTANFNTRFHGERDATAAEHSTVVSDWRWQPDSVADDVQRSADRYESRQSRSANERRCTMQFRYHV